MRPKRNKTLELDFSKLVFSDEIRSIEDCLQEITPIPWSDDVLNGKTEVIIGKTENYNVPDR